MIVCKLYIYKMSIFKKSHEFTMSRILKKTDLYNTTNIIFNKK